MEVTFVVCVVDNSGSISDDELKAFFSEMTGYWTTTETQAGDGHLVRRDQGRQVDEGERPFRRGSNTSGRRGARVGEEPASFLRSSTSPREHAHRSGYTYILTDMIGGFK
jgi:hypothetical protein